MKKTIFLAIFAIVSLICGAQNRQIKEIKTIIKDIPCTKNFEFNTMGFGWKLVPYSFISLKDIKDDKTNNIEKDLLQKYDDVAFCFKDSKILSCYWVKEGTDKIGLVKFDGTILVPPVKGAVHACPSTNRIVLGEMSLTPSQWLEEYHERFTSFNGIGLGHFAAVVDDVDNEKVNVLIPAGKYDDIMVAIKGGSINFYVANYIDNEIKWGLIDKKGTLTIPVENTGIYVKKSKARKFIGNVGGKWMTTENIDMNDIENLVRNNETLIQQRREQLLNTLTEINGTIQQIAATSGQVESSPISNTPLGGTGELQSDNISTVKGDFQTQYQNWENKAMRHYNSLTNLGTKIKKNGKDVGGTSGQSISSSNYTMQKKSLREAQNEMKKIRNNAAKQGVTIVKSQYEDIQVSY